MKTIVLAASLLALSLGVAQAAEGNGDPFPNSGAGRVVVFNRILSDTGSQGTPRLGAPVAVLTQGDVLPTVGSAGTVQTANSLPRNAEEGTVAYAQAQSVARWVAAREQMRASRLAALRGAQYN